MKNLSGMFLPPVVLLAWAAVLGDFCNSLPCEGLLFGQSSLVEPSPKSPQASGRFVALLIGINEYSPGSGLRALRFAESDVQGLASVLRQHKIPSQDIRVFVTSSLLEEKPTKRTIEVALERLASALDKNDTFLVALCGHGVLIDGESYFCPWDAVTTNPATLISLTWLLKTVGESRAGKKIVLIDACRFQANARAISVEESLKIAFQTIPEDIVIFLACKSSEQSHEDESLQHGVFMYYVIQALWNSSEEADLDRNKVIQFPELMQFVSKNVSEFARKYSTRQTPYVLGNFPVWELFPAVRPSSVEQLLQEAENALRSRRWSDAIGLYHQIVNQSPTVAEAYNGLCVAHYEMRDYSDALLAGKKATELKSDDAIFWYNFGRAQYQLQNFDEARKSFEMAARLGDNLPQPHNGMGVIYLRQGQLDGARKEFERAIRLNPDYVQALTNHSNVLAEMNEFEEALRDANRAIELDPEHAMAYNNRGWVYLKKGEYARAVTDFSMALRLEPDNPLYLINRARAYWYMGEYEKSQEDQKRAIEIQRQRM